MHCNCVERSKERHKQTSLMIFILRSVVNERNHVIKCNEKDILIFALTTTTTTILWLFFSVQTLHVCVVCLEFVAHVRTHFTFCRHFFPHFISPSFNLSLCSFFEIISHHIDPTLESVGL